VGAIIDQFYTSDSEGSADGEEDEEAELEEAELETFTDSDDDTHEFLANQDTLSRPPLASHRAGSRHSSANERAQIVPAAFDHMSATSLNIHDIDIGASVNKSLAETNATPCPSTSKISHGGATTALGDSAGGRGEGWGRVESKKMSHGGATTARGDSAGGRGEGWGRVESKKMAPKKRTRRVISSDEEDMEHDGGSRPRGIHVGDEGVPGGSRGRAMAAAATDSSTAGHGPACDSVVMNRASTSISVSIPSSPAVETDSKTSSTSSGGSLLSWTEYFGPATGKS